MGKHKKDCPNCKSQGTIFVSVDWVNPTSFITSIGKCTNCNYQPLNIEELNKSQNDTINKIENNDISK